MTLKKFIAALIGVPLALLFVLFAVANRSDVTISLDPFSADTPAISFALPLFAVVLLSLMAGVVLGGVASWLRQGKWRKEAKRRRAEVNRLETETENARREASVARAALPAPSRQAA